MRTAILNPQGFELREYEVPPYGDDEVLVKTTACGVCGGDVFVYQTRVEHEIKELLLGHEGSGVIVAVGKGVEGFNIGDLVTAIGGAYADYFAIDPQMLVKLPAGIDPIYALGEPIACCVHAGNRFGVQPGDRVAVVGCGFMGLICLQLAKIQGAGHICAIDPVAYRRTMALQLGANEALTPDAVNIADIWQGDFDVVIEVAGSAAALELCGELVNQHGRLILVGYHQSNDGWRAVNMKLWNYKAIDVVNGHVRRKAEKLAAMQQGMTLLRNGQLVVESLVTRYNLGDVEQAFIDFTAQKEGLFKAVLTMETSGEP